MKLYQDDCINVLKNLPTGSIDLVVTDPPYEVETTGGAGSINSVKKMNVSLKELDDLDISTGYDFEAVNDELVRVMKKINIYIWCNKTQIPEYFNYYVNKLGCKFDILCWHKTNAMPTYSNKYLSDTEYCLYFRKGGYCNPAETAAARDRDLAYEDAKTFRYETEEKVLSYLAPINQKDKKLWDHPTIKPLDFTESFIRNSSKPGDVVLDCFMGSGTTGVAAMSLGRDFIGVELTKKYFDIANERINSVIETGPTKLKTPASAIFGV